MVSRISKLFWVLPLSLLIISTCKAQEDDEFMEFYDPDEVEAEGLKYREPAREDLPNEFEMPLENDSQLSAEESTDDDFEPDDEEFEGYIPRAKVAPEKPVANSQKPQLKVATVPRQFLPWNKYTIEMILLAVILIYLVNYLHGRSVNSRIANLWYETHRDILTANFALVGDNPNVVSVVEDNQESDSMNESKSDSSLGLLRDSDSQYTLWCSGRVACQGMLIQIRLAPRQDLCLGLMHYLARPKTGPLSVSSDRLMIKVVLDDGELDSWVFTVGVKKSLSVMVKDHFDLATYPQDRKGFKYAGLPEGMIVLSEIPEVTSAILNPTVLKIFNDHPNIIEYIYISDQYCGAKPSAEELKPPKPNEVQKVLICSFILKEDEIENMKPLFNFVFYLLEKVRKVRLLKDAKARADKARSKVYENAMKSVHQQRQEAAQNRRDEQRRAVKERIMAEEDPEKARRLEEKEQKKEKKRQQRVKMVKMKGM
nr:coiled coil domain containing protein 47 [Hymenolepis microstoma]